VTTKVLALTAYYLPGFKAGGPVRSVANLVDRLGEEIDFRIITADRDLDAPGPYSGISVGSWQSVGKAQVLYVPPTKLTAARILQHIREYRPDLLYLNSFFNPRVCAGPLLLRASGLLPRMPVLIAPRGEFRPGALDIHNWKKRLYLAGLRSAGCLRDIWWHATSDIERGDIERVVGPSARILVAPNLSDRWNEIPMRRSREKQPGKLRLVFLSRISPKKNLLGAIDLLHGLPGKVQFDIWGPIEDVNYWQRCQRQLAQLPANVLATYCGAVEHTAVRSTLAAYDALLFPTLGENFGHVIVEAFTAGCPVVISDRTPWRNLVAKEAGWDLPLEAPAAFQAALVDLHRMNETAHCRMRDGARRLGRQATEGPGPVDASRALFQTAARRWAASSPGTDRKVA
jgi:glycosyltransferase involved in cell wall biosynthesis